MNPNETDALRPWNEGSFVSVEEAEVLTVPTHTNSDRIGHVVEVANDDIEEPDIAQVAASTNGDVELPSEGDTVLVGYREDGNPQVLGVQYTDGNDVPPFEEGTRVVGHPTTNSHVRFNPDGSMLIDVDGGATIELKLNGDVVIDGGTTAPVTDVDFVNETVTRASNVYLPSN